MVAISREVAAAPMPLRWWVANFPAMQIEMLDRMISCGLVSEFRWETWVPVAVHVAYAVADGPMPLRWWITSFPAMQMEELYSLIRAGDSVSEFLEPAQAEDAKDHVAV